MAVQQTFNVYKGRKLTHSVVFSGDEFTKDEVRKILIDRDGFDSNIRVTKARGPATTEVQHIVQVNYGHGHGWEDVTGSTDYKEAARDLQSYRKNAPEYPARLIKRRVKIGE